MLLRHCRKQRPRGRAFELRTSCCTGRELGLVYRYTLSLQPDLHYQTILLAGDQNGADFSMRPNPMLPSIVRHIHHEQFGPMK